MTLVLLLTFTLNNDAMIPLYMLRKHLFVRCLMTVENYRPPERLKLNSTLFLLKYVPCLVF